MSNEAPPSQGRGGPTPPQEGALRPALKYLPGLASLRGYQRAWLFKDLIAGVSVCIIMIPSVIAYAGLIGLPPQHGLYAALVPLLVYSLLGSSRQVIVGPDIAISLLTASTIAPLAGADPAKAAALAALLALLSGVLLLLGARANLGAVADFLSKPVLVGYMTGAALILIISQVDKVLGLKLANSEFFPRMNELGHRLGDTHGNTLLLGVGLLILLFAMRRWTPRVPSALVVCVLAIVASKVFHLEQSGFAVVGPLPSGLPAFVFPSITWPEVNALLPAAIGIALLTYTEGILLARAFAAKNGYEVSPNQELNALGMADVVTGLFQGFSITGSQARTTINDATGGKSQVSSLVAALTLALFLMFLTPLIASLPQVALAVILIFAGVGLIEFHDMRRIYQFSPRSGVVAACTALSVLAAGVVPGIVFGVALSLLGLINRISRPPDAVLSAVPGHGFHDVGNPAENQTVPGLIAYRFYGPLLFSNVGHFVDRVRQLISNCPTSVRWFLLDAQAISDIDVTAVEVLASVMEELRKQGIALKIAHANRPLRELLDRTGFAKQIGPESFFPSVHECIEAFTGSSTSK